MRFEFNDLSRILYDVCGALIFFATAASTYTAAPSHVYRGTFTSVVHDRRRSRLKDELFVCVCVYSMLV